MNGIASNCHGIKTPSIFTMPSNFLRYGQVTVRTINWPKHMAIWKNKTNLHTIAAKKNSYNANTDKYHAVQGNGKCKPLCKLKVRNW